jgi:hypothetical protein
MDKSSKTSDSRRLKEWSPFRNHRWLWLAVTLFAGCTARPEVAVEEEPPPATDTNFDRLADILGGISSAGEVLLYEGLPSEFWEPELRARELRQKETVRLQGYPFYDEAQQMPATDAAALTVLLSARESFARYNSRKSCGGFQPEYCLEWTTGEAGTQALISLECGEVKLYGPRGELYCDLAAAAVQKLKQVLSPYQKNSPAADSGG